MSGLRKKAGWYRNRLAAMSAPEMFHRLHEAIKRYKDKYAGPIATARDLGPLPRIPALREGLEAWDVPEALLTSWEKTYRQAQNGDFAFLGQNWPACPPDEKWHLDPFTQKFWPHDLFCFAIDYRHNRDFGDVKYAWELNRLQYLQEIAALAFVRRDLDAGLFCLAEIESWIDSNPPYRGVNWASGIELTLRSISILVVTTLVGEYLNFRHRAKIWVTLEAHALWLERYPSKFSSANNHRLAEGLGLFVIGALCPQLTGAARWKETGWAILCEAAQTQILADGTGAEQAIAYTATVLEMLLLGLGIAQQSNVMVPDYYQASVLRGGEFLRWFTIGDTQPNIGDSDQSCILGRHHGQYISSILECIAAFSNRGDLAPPCPAPHFRQALFGPPPAPLAAPNGVRCFEEGGYTVGRHQINGRDILLAMDHGYLGYLSIAAHGHADALALWLHSEGQPIFVDAGTYCDHGNNDERDAFRITSAHNTLCLEKTSASIPAGAFNWSRKANVSVLAKELDNPQWWVEAEHDGYKEKFGVTHRRRLAFIPGAGFNVTDQIFGPAAHQVEISFLLHPGLSAIEENGTVCIHKNGHLVLHIQNNGPLAAKVALPHAPDCGWYSEKFGEKQPTTRISFSGPLLPEQKSSLQFFIQ